jgi:hypothetical protein
MEGFIARQNIIRFRTMLDKETDPVKVKRLLSYWRLKKPS